MWNTIAEVGKIERESGVEILFRLVQNRGGLAIDIRQLYKNKEGEVGFTKKGVVLPIESAAEVARLFNDIDDIVKENDNG